MNAALDDLTNRTAVVTGAGNGIGRAVALALASAGATVALLDRDEGAMGGVLAEIRSNGGEGTTYVADLSDPPAVERAAGAVLAAHGEVDIVANSAGIQRYGDVLGTTVATWNEVLAVNVTSVFLVARALLPSLIRRRGAIVNVASVQALGSFGDSVAYVTSKHAVLGLTRAMAADHAPDVRVNCVAPGATDTPMLRASARRANPDDPGEPLRTYAGLHPMGRIASPEEVAGAVVFLAGPRASFITGACLPIDGGMTAVIRQ